jgi:LysM repeat protein
LKKTTMKTRRVVRMPLRRPAQRTRPGGSLLPARAATAEEAYEDEEDYGGEDEPNMKFSHAVIVVLALHIIAVGGIFAFNSIKARQASEAKVSAKSFGTASASSASASSSENGSDSVEKTASTAVPTKVADKPEPAAPAKTHTIQAGETLKRISTLYGVRIDELEKENSLTSYSILRVGQVLKIPANGKSEAKTSSTAPAPATIKAVSPKAATAPAIDKPVIEKPVAAAKPDTDVPGAHGTVSGDTYVVVKGDNPYSIAKKFHVSYSALLAENGIKDATKVQIGQKLKIPAKK